ncbi:MAG: hypothetical protein IKQ89_09320, partial [Muribaculaceae bacterium]|nr:hypothetical protein [Muribaculaceae bacterium]
NTGKSAKIIDFGLADTDQHSVLKQPAGTVSYMAPEQAVASTPDTRNDIYSLGLVLKEMDLGRTYNTPIARCLMPIDDRYQSVDELQADLRRRGHRRRVATMVAAALLGTALIATALALGLNRTTDSATTERVDSLHNQLERTTSVIDQSLQAQDSLVKRLAALNDSLAMLNVANNEMRGEQQERLARQRLIEQAIADGIRRIDADNAATGIAHHLDTLSRGDYIWMDWNYQILRGREYALPRYMGEIRTRFSTKELSEIEYALNEHCSEYENRLRQIVNKKRGVFFHGANVPLHY